MARYYMCTAVIFFLVKTSRSDPCSAPDPGQTGTFIYEQFIYNVREDTAINTTIGKLNIIGGPNEVSLREYSTNSVDDGYLSLDPDSRDITLIKPLDTDTNPPKTGMVFRIQCNITDVHSAVSPVIFTVRVLLDDVNDNGPIFIKRHHNVTVAENRPIGSVIYDNAIAEDADALYGGNNLIEYTILPGPFWDHFDIPLPLTPEIVLLKKLNYEVTSQIVLKIEAKDTPQSDPARSSTATLTITITDVDDLDPKFTMKVYSGVVSADASPGSIVSVSPPINATDQDSFRAPIIYDFISQDDPPSFEINNSTGIVKVLINLVPQNATLVIRATQSDNKDRWAVATLKIIVMGANINGPQFSQREYTTEVSESDRAGTTILTVSAWDKDFGTSLFYSIARSQTVFSIDQSGNIKLKKKLDYESRREYVFNITASDGEYVAYATVRVHVTNVNDNNPLLETPKEITVTTLRKKGTVITTIKNKSKRWNRVLKNEQLTRTISRNSYSNTNMLIISGLLGDVHLVVTKQPEAIDEDPGSVLVYELANHQGLFEINARGEISLKGSEEDFKEDKYTLLVIISDNGEPHRSTEVVVTVQFPGLKLPQEQTTMSAGNDLLVIIFGAVAAVLLLIVILLIVYIIRRHAYTKEQLSRAKLYKGMDPQGLTYRAGDPSPNPSGLDFNYNGELEETSDIDAVEGITGATSIQENPLSDDNINYGFANHPNEGIAENGEIQLDTAVIPYSEDIHYTDSKHSYHNGSLRTFHTPEGSSSGDSSHSDSTGDSNKGLMKHNIRASLTKGKKLSWESNGRVPAYNSDTYLETEKKSKKSKDKPEITVYF